MSCERQNDEISMGKFWQIFEDPRGRFLNKLIDEFEKKFDPMLLQYQYMAVSIE